MSLLKYFTTIFFIAFLFIQKSEATHIVGGEIFYEHISDNRYRLTLWLYLDCKNGLPGAIAGDADANIGIFDAKTNEFLKKFVFYREKPISLNSTEFECAKPPENECIDGYKYTSIVTLPENKNGLIVAYQRCCRNGIIKNIINPGATGSTYWTYIRPPDIVKSNSSAYFNNLPPNFVCINTLLEFDHSATDPDGDELRYSLVTPYLGGKDFDPYIKPLIPSNPPYQNVLWDLGYNKDKMMNGNPALTIDSLTGKVSVIPKIPGNYVIGIKVEEYRDGVLVGETIRDYQINVYNCAITLSAAFIAPTYACSDTVQFYDKSFRAEIYHWDFGDQNTLNDTSSEKNPTYVYPGNGDYKVKLFVKNDRCSTDYETTVKVRSNIELNLGEDDSFCGSFRRELIINLDDVPYVRWFDRTANGRKFVSKPGTYWAEVFYGTCTARDTVKFIDRSIKINPPPDSLFCDFNGYLILLNPKKASLFSWNNGPLTEDYFYPATSVGQYTVKAINESCEAFDTINFYEAQKLEIADSFFFCNQFQKTIGTNNQNVKYLWNTGDTTPFITVNKEGNYTLETTEEHCIFADTVIISNEVVNINLGRDTVYCDTFEPTQLNLNCNLDLTQIVWNTGENDSFILAQRPGNYFVFGITEFGCTDSDTIYIGLQESPDIDLGNDTTICSQTDFELSPGSDFYRYLWNTGQTNSSIIVNQTGNYSVSVWDEFGCTDSDEINIIIDTISLPNYLHLPNSFSPNDNNINEVFPFAFIDSKSKDEFEMMIFNRWGEKVFDSKETARNTWNGLSNNIGSQIGVYYYLINYKTCNSERKTRKGSITLFR